MGRTKKRRWSYIGMLAVSFVLAAGVWGMGFIRPQPPKIGTEAEFEDRKGKIEIFIWLENIFNKKPEEKNPVSNYETKQVEEENNKKSNTGTKDTTEEENSTERINTEDTQNNAIAQEKEASFYTAEASYFDDALFIGDSRTVGLREYGELGNAEVLADSGMSVYRVMNDRFPLKTGEKMTLEELLSSQKYGKAYVMLGINELGYDFDQTVKKYESLIEKIRQMQPGILIFIQANLHISGEKAEDSEIYNNENINRFNEAVSRLADGKEIFYLDVNELFDDENGNLSMEYTTDHAHIMGKYYIQWVQWILEHAVES